MKNITEGLLHIREELVGVNVETTPKVFSSLEETGFPNKDLFLAAMKNWQNKFNPEEIRDLIEELLLLEKRKVLNYSLRRKIKEKRKAALILGSAIRYFSVSQFAPEQLVLFIRNVGRVVDYHAANSDEIYSYADMVLEIIKHNLADIKINLVSIDNSNRRIVRDLNAVLLYLSLDRLHARDYHTMRKTFRHIMNIYQLLAALSLNHDLIYQFQYLNHISSQLGKIHDHHVQGSLSKKDIASETTLVQMDDELKRKVVETVESIKVTFL